MSNYLENLNWRYATKKFDTSKKIAPSDFEKLKEAMRLSASSYGLQPYKILIIEDKDVRTKLKAASWDQPQITDASHMIVLANMTDFGDALVDDYIDNVVQTRGVDRADLKDYAQMMKSTTVALDKEKKAPWSAKQAYIVVGNLLSAAADFKIDACPMEGFENEAYNDILGLKDQDLNASVVITLGYRSKEDDTQNYKKVRKSESTLFKTI
ncbi:NAD(P)H-dependent oxidoreductase [Sediminibacter sp. Hel_I_10]|uniref:NAD(P)H-dependent oxidoreductase n=1 Tax=Sediminibacter sp. Hel_I_10 TaxID=1392490 RepID=UPI00047C0CC4|nr:NAD(P)H-dependent oxidoreductase [Sediminibacter sp. Hel_I_10]